MGRNENHYLLSRNAKTFWEDVLSAFERVSENRGSVADFRLTLMAANMGLLHEQVEADVYLKVRCLTLERRQLLVDLLLTKWTDRIEKMVWPDEEDPNGKYK